ncbi:helix-turn-helix transcriptional regulator [Cupriavidus metallidurans]|uniref:helix-turn-helix transcriptional regulator n=1 Tax=Cupriavidus metallidurans TaxID=119219 RepID=UPI0016495F51|nr:AlpA family phage regulatory protein [Cupriavidus metallidurans]
MPTVHTPAKARGAATPAKRRPTTTATGKHPPIIAPLPARAIVPQAGDRAIDKHEVCALLGIKPSTMYDRITKGLIPPPLRILNARSSRWLLSEIQAILDAAKAQRESV